MSIENFWMFAIAGLLLNLTPGADMLYVIARSSGQGSRAGVVSALGIGTGCFVHILAASAGLSALIARSATAFAVMKYTGAAYLIYLGIKSLMVKKTFFTPGVQSKPASYKTIFWQGVLTNVFNPKVALFFLAFLPQFITVGNGSAALQILLLGTWFNIVGTAVNAAIALLFGRATAFLAASPRFLKWQERVTGVILIALGINVALSSRK